MAHKILERSPLKHSFVWNLQARDPSFAIRKEAAAECMKSVLLKLIDVRCDRIMNQFRQFHVILDKDSKSEVDSFFILGMT